MTRVLIVGGGGREHALGWACARGRDDVELIVAPGNGGTARIAENVSLDATDAAAVARLARERAADLVVIGPDAAAAAGVADACFDSGIAVFGPTAAAAHIESSKSFAKALMDDAGIPTARWASGSASDRGRVDAFIDEHNGRCVVKADGLALGKGVVVCESVEAARGAVDACLQEARFGAAGDRVVVEELLAGDEVSVLCVTDGRNVRVLPTSRDHKRAHDGDTGPNTGGMGAVAPMPAAPVDLIVRRVLQPCVDALRERGTPFAGCLYAGIMLTDSGPQVLEFNARFGDPEAQVVLPLLGEPALPLFEACARGGVQPGTAVSRTGCAVGVVAASAGYPASARTGEVIAGLEDVADDVLCFHAGTREHGGGLVTSGGRVLCLTAVADDLASARECAYANISRVRFDGMWYRADIGAVGATALAIGR
ncbi:MAG: phosphoribosylamine--glycine ligase [Candidatus Dormibacteraeota bacterium]|nr:phosphoribosylamine--glycine ligase [Candidatus Dormibacteraeota bacterium]MBV9525117.1 phosphoribosylamine--glycine ligase [Candidatus Dormibacteraeota bacterium]